MSLPSEDFQHCLETFWIGTAKEYYYHLTGRGQGGRDAQDSPLSKAWSGLKCEHSTLRSPGLHDPTTSPPCEVPEEDIQTGDNSKEGKMLTWLAGLSPESSMQGGLINSWRMWPRPQAQGRHHLLCMPDPNLRPSQPATERWARQTLGAEEKNTSKAFAVQPWALASPQCSHMDCGDRREPQSTCTMRTWASTAGTLPARPVTVSRHVQSDSHSLSGKEQS